MDLKQGLCSRREAPDGGSNDPAKLFNKGKKSPI
jgi:hypothetical protein